MALVGYLRPEKKFSGLDELLAYIKNDIAIAKQLDEETAMEKLIAKRAAIKTVEDCLEPLYMLAERRQKLPDFLTSSIDETFTKKFMATRISTPDRSLALWCKLKLG